MGSFKFHGADNTQLPWKFNIFLKIFKEIWYKNPFFDRLVVDFSAIRKKTGPFSGTLDLKLRFYLTAVGLGFGTAGVEAAAAWNVERAWDVAFEKCWLVFEVGVGAGDWGDKGMGVGVFRVFEDVGGGSRFDNFT